MGFVLRSSNTITAATGQGMNYGLFTPGSFSLPMLALGQKHSCEPFRGRYLHVVPLYTMDLNAHLVGERNRACKLLTV